MRNAFPFLAICTLAVSPAEGGMLTPLPHPCTLQFEIR